MSPEFKSFTTYLKSIASFNEIDLETAMSLVEIKEIKKGQRSIRFCIRPGYTWSCINGYYTFFVLILPFGKRIWLKQRNKVTCC